MSVWSSSNYLGQWCKEIQGGLGTLVRVIYLNVSFIVIFPREARSFRSAKWHSPWKRQQEIGIFWQRGRVFEVFRCKWRILICLGHPIRCECEEHMQKTAPPNKPEEPLCFLLMAQISDKQRPGWVHRGPQERTVSRAVHARPGPGLSEGYPGLA